MRKYRKLYKRYHQINKSCKIMINRFNKYRQRIRSKKVKYKRYKSVIKACNLIRKYDRSFLGIKTINYYIKAKLYILLRISNRNKNNYSKIFNVIKKMVDNRRINHV